MNYLVGIQIDLNCNYTSVKFVFEHENTYYSCIIELDNKVIVILLLISLFKNHIK